MELWAMPRTKTPPPRGATNGEIAKEVHLSPGTVKNYVSEILTALELRDRTQAALLAMKYGWDR